MGSKRGKNINLVNRCILRQVRGGLPFSAQFPRSNLRTWPKNFRLRIPLNKIQKDESFAKGHVLLGFSKCGEYLMSYNKVLQEIDLLLGSPVYKYTLHWWKFNMTKPLQEVFHVPLFVGEVITEDLVLIICPTLHNKDIILVLGYTFPGGDEQCSQCYVTICPSLPRTCRTLPRHDDTWVVHMKYNLLPPFPTFLPFIQLQLPDTILLNTVDFVLAIAVCPCMEASECKMKQQVLAEKEHASCEQPKMNGISSTSGRETLQETSDEKSPLLSKDFTKNLSMKVFENKKFSVQETRKIDVLRKDVCGVVAGSSAAEAKIPPKDIHGQSENNTSSTECSNSLSTQCRDLPHSTCWEQKTLIKTSYDVMKNPKECGNVDNYERLIEIEGNVIKAFQFSSFSFKTFSFGTDSEMELENASNVIDGTSYLDIQVTTIAGTPYNLVECLQDSSREMKDHVSPCVHTRVVSLDVEKYINEEMNNSDELKGKYWLLRNYSTRLVDVCQDSKCVIINIVILISVPDGKDVSKYQQKIWSCSLFLTWSVGTGEVNTLNISQLTDTMKKTEKEIFREQCMEISDLYRKHSLLAGEQSCVHHTYSNRTVFSGNSLKYIKHPFQPIAIVL